MRPDRTLMLLGVLALATMPFAAWGILAAVARNWKANLRPTLAWLRASRWVIWLIGMPLVLAAVLSHEYFWLFPIGASLISASAGLAPVEGWVRRHYAPELLPPESPDGR